MSTKINPLITQPITKKVKFECMECGNKFFKSDKMFFKNISKIYTFNQGYVPICKMCIADLYEMYLKQFDNSEKNATKRICMQFNFYFSDTHYDSAVKLFNNKQKNSWV